MRRSLARLELLILAMLVSFAGVLSAELRVRTVRGDCRIDGEPARAGVPVQDGLIAVSRGGEIVLTSEEMAIAIVGNALVTIQTGGAYNRLRLLNGLVEFAGTIDRWQVTAAPFTLAVRGEAFAVGRSQAGALALTIGRGEAALRDHRPSGLPARTLSARNGATWRADAMAGGLTTFSFFEPSAEELQRFTDLALVVDHVIVWSSWDRGVEERRMTSGER